jgi:hypothetical protein
MRLNWQEVWRRGFAPQLSDRALKALADALAVDDPRLIQGYCTDPVPVRQSADSVVWGACPVTYGDWQTTPRRTVGNLGWRFHSLCAGADKAMGQPRAWQVFVEWWGTTGRLEAFTLLLAEVNATLAERKTAHV